ncbi:MAG: fructosamine kinase family protein [Oceanipulchritudo sp.]
MGGQIERAIEKAIGEATGESFELVHSSGIGGGCIHDATCASGADGRQFFVKRNELSLLPCFEAEAHALRVIRATRTIRVPEPVAICRAGGQAALILEFLPMGGGGRADWFAMGEQFARMHRATAERFGWPHDNWIGSAPQKNTEMNDWIRFYTECRLRPQVEWARRKGLRIEKAEALEAALPRFFEDYTPVPSLLHGDLWAGNADFMNDGTPVIFDPASYYGDREADLAMTEMFGGFTRGFYKGYASEWPLHEGYRTRKQLYLLYHTLNHYNLFGGGYGSSAESLVAGLLDSLA